jgi:hypothetical protein
MDSHFEHFVHKTIFMEMYCRCRISPGSIITPLAEEFLKNTPNPEATRQIFRDVSVSVLFIST